VAARVKVALVHEWLLTHGGSEEITGQLCALFPDADLFTLVSDPVPSLRALIGERRIITSWLQHIPGATRHHRKLLPLMPRAIESFDFTGYDLVISVSHAVAKGVRTAAPTVHLNICCSPVRYAWDLQEQYLEESGLAHGLKGFAARRLLAAIRSWDKRTAHRPDEILAISAFIAERIQRAWGRSAAVLYPPVDTEYFARDGSSPARENDLYVTASRFVPYKRIPLIVDAFARMPTRRLVVIGDGTEMEKARALATPNVTLMGHLPRAALRGWLHRARGFVFAAEEDFGIAPVEALAAGTPVVAFGRGGARETVGADSGVFFEHQTTESIVDAVHRLEESQERNAVTEAACVARAQRFSAAVFRAELRARVQSLVLPG
jgi:glycosyltransferase involved in cell wall biosynthesis